jgi:hypothetical protein
VSPRLALSVFVDISTTPPNPGIRATVTPVWKLSSYKAAKLAAPCFGFVDALRSALLHAEAVLVHR